jgi:hypothetical protein
MSFNTPQADPLQLISERSSNSKKKASHPKISKKLRDIGFAAPSDILKNSSQFNSTRKKKIPLFKVQPEPQAIVGKKL